MDPKTLRAIQAMTRLLSPDLARAARNVQRFAPIARNLHQILCAQCGEPSAGPGQWTIWTDPNVPQKLKDKLKPLWTEDVLPEKFDRLTRLVRSQSEISVKEGKRDNDRD